MRVRRSDGADVWVRRTAVLVRHEDGSPKYVVAQIEDLSVERAAQDQLAYQAFHDPLTGLRNRAWVLEMIEEEVRSTEPGHGVGVLFLDLDNMKVVNDSLGHDAGDTVILEMGRRIGRLLNPGTHLGRFGGDEFVVIVPRVGDPRVLVRLADRLLDAIAAPVEVDGHRVVPAASIGLVLSATGATAASLLRDADSALSRAKASGRARWHFFDERMHSDAVARLTVEDELRRAIAEHELVVHYQPIVRLSDRRVVGHEALVRWQHPTRGLVPPLDFLPVAEESGLVVHASAHRRRRARRRPGGRPRRPRLGAPPHERGRGRRDRGAGADPRRPGLDARAGLAVRTAPARAVRRLRPPGPQAIRALPRAAARCRAPRPRRCRRTARAAPGRRRCCAGG
jgi:diguanylate cyclase (GGDEF)-like protein